MVEADPKSEYIIKPILRGQDIRSFHLEWAGLWLINVPWHFPLQSDSSIQGVSEKAEGLFKKQYPAVYQHLLSHKAALSARNKAETGIRYEWYALQRWAASYHGEFAKEKVLWMDMSPEGRFAYSNQEIFCNDKAYLVTGKHLRFLCAVLNSSLVGWMVNNTTLTTGMGVTQWKKFVVERIPIPKLSAAKQRPFVRLVDRILEAKDADPDPDTSELEEQIDWLVYDLYGLTDEETAAVADYFWDGSMSEDEENLALVRAMDEGDVNDRVSLAEVREILRAPDEC